MSALSSTSTLADIEAAYDNNASYAENGSLTEARSFASACRLLLRRVPQNAAKDGESLQTTIALIQEELRKAEEWISIKAAVTSGGVKRASLRGFRS